MNERNRKLLEKWMPITKHLNPVNYESLDIKEEVINLCRNAEQMEQDIKEVCENCMLLDTNCHCYDTWCEFHKY